MYSDRFTAIYGVRVIGGVALIDLRNECFRRRAVCLLALCWVLASPVFGQEQQKGGQQSAVADDHARHMRNGLELFRTKVRKLLIKHCAECHGQKQSEGGLNLLTRKGLLAGGETEPAVVPGKADKSLLVRLIEHQDEPAMPVDRPRLSKSSIKAIRDWIDNGAPYDKPLIDGPTARVERRTITDADRKFWSFRPLTPISPPVPGDSAWCRTKIDRFILAKIEKHGLRPLSAASREKLIRRASLDLLGLPPSPEEIDAFVNDPSDNAWGTVIDRLLASPHYGERWGRHWLDAVRFAESYGFEHDLDNENAYHYRDFVIRALNDDMPYDRFVRWQLAGDELAPDKPLARMATGFLAAGVHNADFAKVRVEQERYDELDDIASTIGTSMLGLSIGCARCHDHKYDPISQESYYRFITAFERTVRGEIELAVWPGDSKKSKVLVAGEGVTPLARIYNPGPAFFEKTWFLRRGDTGLKGHEVSPGFLEVLMPADATARQWNTSADAARKAGSTFRRTALSKWITDTKSGAGSLLARVIVNRLWQHHFGRGIVATPNDFGARGTAATHPALLDWLTTKLTQGGWRLKTLHRQIMLSATYRQDVTGGWRSPLDEELFRGRKVRRLEAEAIRDSMLAISGGLDRTMYGPGTLAEDQPRRSIYYKVKRSQMIRMMTLFDAPDALQGIGRRPSTTVAPQALALMNGPLVEQFAMGLAGRLSLKFEEHPDETVQRAFRETLGRMPTDKELSGSLRFIQRQQKEYGDKPPINSPASEGSVVLWLDATALPDENVTQWNSRGPSAGALSFRPIDGAPRRVVGSTPLKRHAVRFDKGVNILRASDHLSLNFGTGDFTITTLFRIASSARDDNHILGKDSFPGQGNSYTGYFLQHSGNRLRFATRDLRSGKGPVNYLDSTKAIRKGRWYRLTAVRESGTLRLFFNDSAAADGSLAETSPTNVNSPTGFKIGDMDEHRSGAFQGDIAELLIYNRALSEDEIHLNHDYLSQKYLAVAATTAREHALADFCQALFCLNEFIYVE